MPVLLKFSNAAYNRLGPDVLEELVTAMNQVYDAKREMDDLRRAVDRLAEQIQTLTQHVADRSPVG